MQKTQRGSLSRKMALLLSLVLTFTLVTPFGVLANGPEQLPAPVISVNGSVVSWEAVPEAESYRLYMHGADIGVSTRSPMWILPMDFLQTVYKKVLQLNFKFVQ